MFIQNITISFVNFSCLLRSRLVSFLFTHKIQLPSASVAASQLMILFRVRSVETKCLLRSRLVSFLFTHKIQLPSASVAASQLMILFRVRSVETKCLLRSRLVSFLATQEDPAISLQGLPHSSNICYSIFKSTASY